MGTRINREKSKELFRNIWPTMNEYEKEKVEHTLWEVEGLELSIRRYVEACLDCDNEWFNVCHKNLNDIRIIGNAMEPGNNIETLTRMFNSSYHEVISQLSDLREDFWDWRKYIDELSEKEQEIVNPINIKRNRKLDIIEDSSDWITITLSAELLKSFYYDVNFVIPDIFYNRPKFKRYLVVFYEKAINEWKTEDEYIELVEKTYWSVNREVVLEMVKKFEIVKGEVKPKQ